MADLDSSVSTVLDDSISNLTTDLETETDSESDYFSAIDTSKNPKVESLLMENTKLKKELAEIEERTAEKIKKQFTDLFTNQEEYFRKLLRDTGAANVNLNKRRLSLAVKCMKESPQLCSPFGSANRTVVANPHGKRPVVATPPNPEMTMDIENQPNSDTDTDTNTTQLLATISELEENAEVRESYIVKLQQDIRGMIDQIANLQNTVEFTNSQTHRDSNVLSNLSKTNMKDVAAEGNNATDDDMDDIEADPLNMSTQSLTEKMSQHEESAKFEKLSEEEREKYETKIQILEKDLADARELCVEYHKKLEESNSQAEYLTQEVTELHLENVRLKEDEDFLNVMISDLKTQINELKAKLHGKRGRESMDFVAAKSIKRAKRVSISVAVASKRSKDQTDEAPKSRGRKARKQNNITSKKTEKDENPENSFLVTSLHEEDLEEEEVVPFTFRIPEMKKESRPAKLRLPRRAPARPEHAEFTPVSLSPLQNIRK